MLQLITKPFLQRRLGLSAAACKGGVTTGAYQGVTARHVTSRGGLLPSRFLLGGMTTIRKVTARRVTTRAAHHRIAKGKASEK